MIKVFVAGFLVYGSLALSGCSGGDAISKAELDRAAHSKPPSAEQWSKVTQGMATGANAAKEHERKWVKDHPEEAKKVNAERARAGLPPLGK